MATIPQEVFKRDRKELTASLHRVASGDKEGQMLEAFFAQHGRFSRLIGRRHVDYERGTDIHRIEGGEDIPVRDFLITPCSLEERKRYDIDSDAIFQYAREWNAIFIPSFALFTSAWMGIRFAHELRHAFDFLTGLEPPLPEEDESSELEFSKGELRAHCLEQRLLDRFTAGRFRENLDKLARRLPAPAGFPQKWFLPKTHIEMSFLDSLFPSAKSKEEQNARLGAYMMALNYQYAEQLGLGDEGKLGFTRNYFFNQSE